MLMKPEMDLNVFSNTKNRFYKRQQLKCEKINCKITF